MRKYFPYFLVLVGLTFNPGCALAQNGTPPKKSLLQKLSEKTYYGGALRLIILSGNYLHDAGENDETHNYINSPLKAIMPELQFYLGQYFPLKESGGNSSIGLSPNLSFGAGKNKDYSYSGSLELSLYIKARYIYPHIKTGETVFSAGLGYEADAIYSQFEINNFFYTRPSAIFEVGFARKERIYTIGISGNLFSYQYNYPSYTGDIPGPKIRNFALHFVVN